MERISCFSLFLMVIINNKLYLMHDVTPSIFSACFDNILPGHKYSALLFPAYFLWLGQREICLSKPATLD